MTDFDTKINAIKRRLWILFVFVITLLISVIFSVFHSLNHGAESEEIKTTSTEVNDPLWIAPDTLLLGNTALDLKIKYGRELIKNTALYFGPKGKIAHNSNGMNCQNCHLDAGTKPFGNNYSAVASTYPKFRERSGKIESISKRVNDCFERSLNGKALDTNSEEMSAIIAYIQWLGAGIEKGIKPLGSGLKELPYLDRAANLDNGKKVYTQKCMSCHLDGSGLLDSTKTTYFYPPLWGEHSYNSGAGLYRLSRIAAYVKANMPFGTTFKNPQLSDEEAWDVAAYVNSQPRPMKDLSADWPNIAGKPIDHPFGPYADQFTELQHKYGPFEMIAIEKKKKQNH